MLQETHASAEQNRRQVKIHFVDEPGPQRLLGQTGATDTTTAAGYDSTTIRFYAAQFFQVLSPPERDKSSAIHARQHQPQLAARNDRCAHALLSSARNSDTSNLPGTTR
jgi:hypothetical protein